MTREPGEPAMRIYWDTSDRVEETADWAATAGELEGGLPLHSGRALTWISAAQAIIRVSGLLFIIYACLQ